MYMHGPGEDREFKGKDCMGNRYYERMTENFGNVLLDQR